MKRICILMSTYNGERYLKEQLDSILNQKEVQVYLIIRDDGSTDNTFKILEEYSSNNDNIVIPSELSGFHNKEGIGSSFFKLLRYAITNFPDVNYFGFSDQDDVWFKDKCIRAINAIQAYEEPALYFSRTQIVDEKLNVIGKDPLNYHGTFCDYLNPNDAAGCTMVLNRTFANIILNKRVEELPWLHDVILFRTAMSINAHIVFDSRASMNYRQHENNVEGVRKSKLLSFSNIKKIFSKRNHKLTLQTRDIINFYGDLIPKENYIKLMQVLEYRKFKNGIRLINEYRKNAYLSNKDKLRFLLLVIFRVI